MSIDFDKARDKAFGKLKTDRKKASLDSAILIDRDIKDAMCARQVRVDLAIYPLWDAVAMWMDKNAGLARYFPEDMERVARRLELTGLSEHIT